MPSIIRPRLTFEDRVTYVPNAWLNDARLSLAARGVLVFLLSQTIGDVADLPEDDPEFDAGISELERHGYVQRVRVGDDGACVWALVETAGFSA